MCRWGYEIRSEILWIKTNQLQRLIRTGRTGHWLNHSKEHCIIGIKGNPQLNRNLDCDVIVAEVPCAVSLCVRLSCSPVMSGACRCERRAASPMRSTRCWYTLSLPPLCPQCGVLDWQDRLIPGSRKLEIFGRQHNTQPGWITLGNQLDGIRLADPDVIARVSLIELPQLPVV
jgi:mRNA (2'-O-methyladenosine-N6-)-methyltransferase